MKFNQNNQKLVGKFVGNAMYFEEILLVYGALYDE